MHPGDCARQTLIPQSYDAAKADTADLALYKHTVQRVHNGENYYSALGGVCGPRAGPLVRS